MRVNEVLERLRAHEGELRSRGVDRLSVFGSFARGEAGPSSDVDLAVHFASDARIDLFEFAALSERMRELLGRRVDLVSVPARIERMQRQIDRDRVDVF